MNDKDHFVRKAAKENLERRQATKPTLVSEPKPVAKKPKPATPKYKNYIKFH